MRLIGNFIGRPLILAALLFAMAAAARAEIVVAPEIGLGNSYKAGGWTPLRIGLINRTSPLGRDQDFDGRVQATTTDKNGVSYSFAMPLELPIGGRKLVEIPIVLPWPLKPVNIQLITTRGRIVYSADLMPNTVELNLDNQRKRAIITPTILLLSSPTETPSFLSTVSDADNSRMIEAVSMPRNYKSYDGVRLLVIRQGISGQLDPDQLDALDQWLRLGGRLLVVTPKAAAEIRQDRWLAPRMPALPIESRELALSEINPAATAERTLLTGWGEPVKNASLLWNSPAGPIAYERPYGMGSIVALGIDPMSLGSSPVRSAIASFDEALVLSPTLEDIRARHYWETSNIMPFKDAIGLPNRFVIILIIAIFVIVVGPMNFSFLRKRRRLELAWGTIPALSILFFSAIYGYGVLSKGGLQHFGSAEILHISAGQPDGLLLWNAMQFSPSRQVYHLSAGPTGSIFPLINTYDDPRLSLVWNVSQRLMNAAGLERGAGGGSGGLALASPDGGYELSQPTGQWEAMYYAGERPMHLKGTIDGDVTLLPDDTCRVRIVNNTEAPLKNAMLRIGALRLQVGQIDAGKTFDENLKASLSAAAAAPERNEPNRYRGRSTHDSPENADPGLQGWANSIANKRDDTYPNIDLIHPQRRCRLIAQQEAWPSQIKVDPAPNTNNSLGLIEVDLPLRIEGKISLKTGDHVLRREVYNIAVNENPRGSVYFGDNGCWCQVDAGWVDVVVGPPRLANAVKITGGGINLTCVPHGQEARIQAFNYRSNQWEPMFENASGEDGGNARHVELKPEWVNPWSPMARFRIESRPIPNAKDSDSNPFLDIRNFDVQMDLVSANAKVL